MLPDRDYEVVRFVKDYKIAKTSTLIELFYPSYRVGCYRLNAIVAENELKRERPYRNYEFIYYYKKPEYPPHWILITDFYLWLSKRYEIEEFRTKEITKKGLCPDAEFYYQNGNESYFGMLEIELSNKGFNFDKYFTYYRTEEYKNNYPYEMPDVFLITKLNQGLKKLIPFDKYKIGKLYISDQIYEQEI
jgi:hypothetical protein